MEKRLNRREQTILNYIQNGGNMKQAMVDAGYSKKNARNIASENLAKPNIKEYIEKWVAEQGKRLNDCPSIR